MYHPLMHPLPLMIAAASTAGPAPAVFLFWSALLLAAGLATAWVLRTPRATARWPSLGLAGVLLLVSLGLLLQIAQDLGGGSGEVQLHLNHRMRGGPMLPAGVSLALKSVALALAVYGGWRLLRRR